MSRPDPRRAVPATNEVLAAPVVAAALQRWSRPVVLASVRAAQAAVRSGEVPPAVVADAVIAGLPTGPSSLHRVINATGVVLHTNLGRAPLSAAARAAVDVAAGYTGVEWDAASGRRRRRGAGALDALRSALPSAGDVAVVNNGAAALLLALTVLAGGREVVWGRGELVEIGDGFRLPDLAVVTGARLREVGTTNRTTLADYAGAIGPETGCILKVHPSNFVVSGFTSSVGVGALGGLGVPVVVDVGSGLLAPDPLLPDEPDVTTAIEAGAALVTASGDKLLGGPQLGIIAGSADLVTACRRHPLARALRVGKLALAALEATLLGPTTPVRVALQADPADLRRRADALAEAVAAARPGVPVEVVGSEGAVGGGGAPGVVLPGWAVALPAAFAARLRVGDPCVVGRVVRDRCLLDLRCVPPDDDAALLGAVTDATPGT